MKTLLITLAFAAAFVPANPAAAQPATRTAAVSVAGLDLTTDQGRRALDLRIVHAAADLCGTPSPADARGRIRFEDCRDQLRTAAAEQARVLAARAGNLKVAAR
ncbi:UrcA family protein [Sphingomonas sp. ID1715]|uniref:UrcA family protein n=1 Tax=Sphingomonas sp. ID1715 TaxID=1656898 RepID=UPI0014888F8A|nr:UrcA family protein [Sphingomonas sp. ID1715]NNM77372.1 UrcA family protein [Sphingomonas sp. ID1715]